MATTVRFPQLKSWKDLTECGTITRGDPPGETSTFMVHVDSEGHAYLGYTQSDYVDLTPEEIEECLKPIPDEALFPVAPEGIRAFVEPITESLYVKTPDVTGWNSWENSNDSVADLLLGEVETLELLSRHPHLNIVRYHGCQVKNGRVRGIVLTKCFTTLQQALKGHPKLDLDVRERNAIMVQITSAVDHIHGLGLAHNDLSPYNIMLSEDKFPYLIDFGSCRPIGARLLQAGTAGFVEEYSNVSAFKKDKFALDKIKEWLGI